MKGVFLVKGGGREGKRYEKAEKKQVRNHQKNLPCRSEQMFSSTLSFITFNNIVSQAGFLLQHEPSSPRLPIIFFNFALSTPFKSPHCAGDACSCLYGFRKAGGESSTSGQNDYRFCRGHQSRYSQGVCRE